MLFVFFDQVGLSKLKTEFFLLQGNKVNEFLQRIITNNVNALNKNDPLYSLILTVRGKFLADFFLYQYGKDCVMLEVDKLYSDLIKKSISFYDLHGCFDFSQVQYNSYISLEKISGEFSYNFADKRNSNLGYKIITKKELSTQDDILNKYDLNRIRFCVPDCSKDLVSGSSFPLEYNLDYAFSFDKGCYVGQEVVSRFKFRGLLKRKMFTCKTTGQIPEPHTAIENNDGLSGKFLSGAGNFVLALLEIGKLPKGHTFLHKNQLFEIIQN